MITAGVIVLSYVYIKKVRERRQAARSVSEITDEIDAIHNQNV